jgi:ubiquinone/menaquinone biosynthesis C-methylase UbiE
MEIAMNIEELEKNWDSFGKIDPLWAILTLPEKQGGKWDVTEFFSTGKAEIASLRSDLDSLQIRVPRGQALDFGCGVGRLTQALAEHHEQVTGVDIAPSMIERAKEFNRYGDRCTYVLNERDDLGCFGDNSFDFIYSNYTLQHMQPHYAERYLREFVRVLRPHGVLVFQLPSTQVPQQGFKGMVRRMVPAPLLQPALNIRNGRRTMQPVMETHVVPRDRVVELLRSQRATIIDVRRNRQHDSRWVSLIYYVTKG